MQRNWDVVRKILLKIESLPPNSTIDSNGFGTDGIDGDTAAYHMGILLNADLINGGISKTMNGPLWCHAEQLTWEGHEFLDSIRDESNWNKVKETVKDKGVDLSFDVIKTTAKIFVANLLA